MTTEEALKLLDSLVSKAALSRADHATVEQAVSVIRDALNRVPVEPQED